MDQPAIPGNRVVFTVASTPECYLSIDTLAARYSSTLTEWQRPRDKRFMNRKIDGIEVSKLFKLLSCHINIDRLRPVDPADFIEAGKGVVYSGNWQVFDHADLIDCNSTRRVGNIPELGSKNMVEIKKAGHCFDVVKSVIDRL